MTSCDHDFDDLGLLEETFEEDPIGLDVFVTYRAFACRRCLEVRHIPWVYREAGTPEERRDEFVCLPGGMVG